MRFDQLQLAAPLLRAVAKEGYETATPIQQQAIPHVLGGRDLLGCAQTGTGKTAAFALPIIHRLTDNASPKRKVAHPRCLVLCPTRELATQIADGFQTYGANVPLRGVVIFGGVSQRPQVAKLRRGLDVIVATPGRLLDLMNQGHVDLSGIETLVLDEADRMLDMGFMPDIRKIVAKVPTARQTLMFSATMPREIRVFADTLLNNPVTVQIATETTTADGIEQTVYFVDKAAKPEKLAALFNELSMSRAIVFTRTKHGADRLVRQLHVSGIRAEAIHGNKTQNNRQRALDNFRRNKVAVLVATDIAARGIDVDGISHVINYDLPHEPETYVHRIGRTARAGAAGAAIAFCDREEVGDLRAIERLLKTSIPVTGDRPAYADQRPASSRPSRSHSRGSNNNRPRGHKSRSNHNHSAPGSPAGGFKKRRRPAKRSG
jgi:ATP-dependent RNA helicase RhlE